MVKLGRIGSEDGIMVHKSGQGRIWPNEIRSESERPEVVFYKHEVTPGDRK